MKVSLYKSRIVFFLLFILALSSCQTTDDYRPAVKSTSEVLLSWNQGAAKQAIINFVKRVSDPASSDYIKPAGRVAVFDNDGTLWAEQPLYFQIYFIFDQIRAKAAEHPDWKNKQPFKAVLENDTDFIKSMPLADIFKLTDLALAGMTQTQFEAEADDFITRAKHPERGVLLTQMVYQPMLELLDYLHQHQFKVFIVSGGGIDFIRAFSEEIYGIPKENVIGSAFQTEFVKQDKRTDLMRTTTYVQPFNDKEGKPVNLYRYIGRRPILAFGNSDGDLQMLQYAAGGQSPALMMLMHHDDAEREWAYDRKSPIGHLDKALDEAQARGWTVVSIKNDFKQVFPN
jgi:phosphoglycolate phosphatase-like HAD superfamily hydrolase